MDDPASLKDAVADSYAVFSVTNCGFSLPFYILSCKEHGSSLSFPPTLYTQPTISRHRPNIQPEASIAHYSSKTRILIATRNLTPSI